MSLSALSNNRLVVPYSYVPTSQLMSLNNMLLLSKPYVTIPLCSYVTMSSKPMSLKNMFFCHYVSKAMYLCLIQKPHPVSLG